MMEIKPKNNNIIVKVLKIFDELKTKSGIILVNVEQDVNAAEVVAVPDRKTYRVEERDQWGSYVRDSDGNPKETLKEITVKPGDKILFERNFHHDYNEHDLSKEGRKKIDHMV